MSASVKESLQLQLLEMEMLFSMFPNQGEVKLEDVNALTNIKRGDFLVPQTGFCPTGYTLQWNPQLFHGTFDPGELCVCAAIQWLQDNCGSYFLSRKLAYEPSAQAKPVKSTFLRMWIYSHHIYQQDLRKKILEVGKRLDVTGFCMTGKPGIICVEGLKGQCEEFWHTIRYPNWKHISCKHAESVDTEGDGRNLRLFHAFEELLLEAHGDYGLRNDYHMNLGQFLEFLKKHKSEHVFQILFGIESKSSES
ncbi:RWD domain-containing protein 2A isoform X2 [Nycticebus coucang]|uniref:RWD domain-containing protein 2A isoform X2 n=1 Tax=Nycticebus coucang TaxID=9470 RepID=UPI00234DC040|nr:RWD domain-containing protein 2A isoform X2 [Nycticebus coucang]